MVGYLDGAVHGVMHVPEPVLFFSQANYGTIQFGNHREKRLFGG